MAVSAGGREVGRVSVRVVPDVSRFVTELRADLAKIREQVKVEIPVVVDTTGLAEKARAASAEANAAAGKIHIETDIDTNQIGRAAAGLGDAADNTGRMGGFMSKLVPLIIIVAAAAGVIAPAIAVSLPIVFGLGAAVGAVALAFAGLKKALSPIGAAFAKLKTPITNIVTAGLAPLVKVFVNKVVPALTGGLKAAAGLVNDVLRGFLGLVQQTKFLAQLSALFTGAAHALRPLSSIIQFLVLAFVDLGNAALPALGQTMAAIARSVEAFATSMNRLASTGQLQSIISTSVSALGLFLHVAGQAISVLIRFGINVAPFLLSLASGLKPLKPLLIGVGLALLAFVSPLGAVAAAVVFLGANFAKVKAFFAPLKPLFDQVVVALAPLLAAFKNLGSSLGSVFKNIAPSVDGLRKSLSGIGPKVVAGIAAVAPVLAKMVNAIANNQLLLGRLTVVVAGLVNPVLGVAVALAFLTTRFAAIQAFVQSQILPLFAGFATEIQPGIAAFRGLGDAVQGLFAAILPVVQQVFAVIAVNFPAMRDIVVQVFSTIGTIVSAAMLAIKAQITVATIAIQFIWQHFGSIILRTISTVLSAVLGVIKGVLNVIQGVFRLFIALLTGDWSGAWAAIRQIVSGAVSAIVSLVRGAFGLFRGIADTAVHAVLLVLQGAGRLWLSVFTGIGHIFEDVGRWMVEGIVNGIKSIPGAIGGALEDAVMGPFHALQKRLQINSPSKLFAEEVGSPISEGIAYGISQNGSMVHHALTAITNPSGTGVAGMGGRGGSLVHVDQIIASDENKAIDRLMDKAREAVTVHNLSAALGPA